MTDQEGKTALQKAISLKWQFIAGGILLGGLFMSKPGLMVLRPMLKFLAPCIAIYLIFNLVKKKVSAKVADVMRQHGITPGGPGAAPGAARGAPGGQKVIDLCPKCGAYLAPGHRCKKA